MPHDSVLAGERSTPALTRKLDRQDLWVPELTAVSVDPTVSAEFGAWHLSGHAVNIWGSFTFATQGSGILMGTVPFPPDPNFIGFSGTAEAVESVGSGRARASSTADSRLLRAQFRTSSPYRLAFMQDASNSFLTGQQATWTRLWFEAEYLADPAFLSQHFVAASGNFGETGSEPLGTEPGDVLIALAKNVTDDGPEGWTKVGDTLNDTSVWIIQRSVSAPALNWTDAGGQVPAVDIGTWRDVSPVPVDSATGTAGSAVAPSVTATAASQILVCLYADLDFPDESLLGVPPGMTDRTNTNDPDAQALVLADQTLTASGATGTRTFTGQDPAGAWSLILAPAA